MKKILICLFAFGSLLCGSCSDWLEVYPKNEQITANYWKAKEDVEAVLASGYSSLRACTRTLKNRNCKISKLQLPTLYAVGHPYTKY